MFSLLSNNLQICDFMLYPQPDPFPKPQIHLLNYLLDMPSQFNHIYFQLIISNDELIIFLLPPMNLFFLFIPISVNEITAIWFPGPIPSSCPILSNQAAHPIAFKSLLSTGISILLHSYCHSLNRCLEDYYKDLITGLFPILLSHIYSAHRRNTSLPKIQIELCQ